MVLLGKQIRQAPVIPGHGIDHGRMEFAGRRRDHSRLPELAAEDCVT